MLGDTTAFSSFSVDDTGTARTFYEDVLGLQVTDGPMEGILGVRLGSGATVMVYGKGAGHQPASFTVLHFPVEDLPGTVDALAAKGVSFERYPDLGEVDERGIHSGGEGPGIAWFTDPAGNVIAVLAADEGLGF